MLHLETVSLKAWRWSEDSGQSSAPQGVFEIYILLLQLKYKLGDILYLMTVTKSHHKTRTDTAQIFSVSKAWYILLLSAPWLFKNQKTELWCYEYTHVPASCSIC